MSKTVHFNEAQNYIMTVHECWPKGQDSGPLLIIYLYKQVGGDISGERIVLLSSRADCVLALNEKGDLFGWGNNEYGQLLGATKEMQLHTPKHIKLNKKLKGAAAGGSACVVLDGNSLVYQ